MSSKIIYIINEILSWIVSGGLALVVVAVMTFAGYKTLEQQEKNRVACRAQLIQELCSENPKYDFCEVETVVYKKKGKNNVDK